MIYPFKRLSRLYSEKRDLSALIGDVCSVIHDTVTTYPCNDPSSDSPILDVR